MRARPAPAGFVKPGFLDPADLGRKGKTCPPGKNGFVRNAVGAILASPSSAGMRGRPTACASRSGCRCRWSSACALNHCAARLDGPLEGRLDAILHDARLAHRSFGAALIQFQRLDNWALPTELEVQERAPAT